MFTLLMLLSLMTWCDLIFSFLTIPRLEPVQSGHMERNKGPPLDFPAESLVVHDLIC